MKTYKASCPTRWGNHIKAQGESRLAAVMALHKVARLTGNPIDFSRLIVKIK